MTTTSASRSLEPATSARRNAVSTAYSSKALATNFDEDKSGNVDYGEFRRGLAHLGIALSDGDFETLLGVVDNDGSGTIDYNEFVEGALPASQQQPACNGDSRLKEAPLLSRIEGRTGCSHSACV